MRSPSARARTRRRPKLCVNTVRQSRSGHCDTKRPLPNQSAAAIGRIMLEQGTRDSMKKILSVAALVLLAAPSVARAQERAGPAALGAVSGALVLGPVGAVAGAIVGFAAGPSIARAWGVRSMPPPPPARAAKRAAPRQQTSASGTPSSVGQASATVGQARAEIAAPRPAAKPPANAPAAKMPPAQTLE